MELDIRQEMIENVHHVVCLEMNEHPSHTWFYVKPFGTFMPSIL